MQELQTMTSDSMKQLLDITQKHSKALEEITNRLATLEKGSAKHDRALRDIEEEYPLLPPEADDLSKAVQRKGVNVLGGKDSNAYNNTALRKKVYQDIYTEIKRQYGLIEASGRQLSYKKLKRKHLKGAMGIVEEYEAPIALQNEIEAENDLEDIMD